jgi:hypothetical protein
MPKYRIPVAQKLRERIDKWDYIKLESFCKAKEMINMLKRQPIEWEKCLSAIHLTRDNN